MTMRQVPLTEDRKQAFIVAIRKTGSIRAAARLASPGSGGGGARTTFQDAMKRDPVFAAAVQEAMDDALGTLEAEAMRRATQGYKKPIFQKGQLVGYEDVYSDNLLLALLRARSPETYSERRDVHVTGQVVANPQMLTIDVADLHLLNQDERDTLLEILEKLAVEKGELAPENLRLIEQSHD